MDDPLPIISADVSRHPGVGVGAALIEHPAQPVSPLGLHHRVHVHPGGKARAQGDGDGGHVPGGTQVALGQNGVHQSDGVDVSQARPGLIHQQGDLPSVPHPLSLLWGVDPAAGGPFHPGHSVVHRLTQGHLTPYGGGVGALQGQNKKSALMQAQNGAGGQISPAPHHNRSLHGRITFPALARVSAITYILVTLPTASCSVRP